MSRVEISPRSHRPGFTLIELLVVIAIIAVLAAILFPVFSKAKSTGARASCLGNLKQIGAGYKLYQEDYHGDYPSSGDYPYSDPHWKFSGWIHQLLTTTATSRKLFFCPGAGKQDTTGSPLMKVSYSMNEYIFFRYHKFYNDSFILRPRHTLLLSDGYGNQLIQDWNDDLSPRDYMGLPSGMVRLRYADGIENGVPRVRHGGSNVLFCDLHCVTVMPDNVKALNYNNNPSGVGLKEYPLIYPNAAPYL